MINLKSYEIKCFYLKQNKTIIKSMNLIIFYNKNINNIILIFYIIIEFINP